MSTLGTQRSKICLNMTLTEYVDSVQQQMKQAANLSAASSKTVQQQAKLEKFISRQLVKSPP